MMTTKKTWMTFLPCMMLAAFVLPGCQSAYRNHTKKMMQAYVVGDYVGAAVISKEGADKQVKKRKDKIAYYLEAARTAQVAGNVDDSIGFYDAVFEDIRPYLDTKAEGTVTEGVATTAVNQAISVYKATPGERVMFNTLNALNYLAVGDLDTARLELNRAGDWQEDAVQRYSKEIEAAQKKADESAAENNVKEEDKNNGVPGYLQSHYTDLEDLSSYANFQNPFTSHLRGVFLMACGTDDGDKSNARFDLRMAASTNPECRPAIDPDIMELDKSQRHSMEPTTWIYFMTGNAPRLEEFRIDIPIPVGDVNYISAAFPRLKRDDNFYPYLDVMTSDGNTTQSLQIVNVDNIIASEFKSRLPAIITQEIASSVGKAAATYALGEAAGTWGKIAGIIYQAASTSADLRTWRTLPKQVHLVRILTPSDGQVYLSTEGGRDLGMVTVAASESNIVVVTIPSTQAQSAAIASTQITGISSKQYVRPIEILEDDSQKGDKN